jgi:exopolyphosphatase/guanosine-5'-triphosphate,3'-diphosphate pyrophosphatase
MYCERKNIPNLSLPDSPMGLELFDEIYQELIHLNKSERMAMPGMMAWRAEMIVVTCSLIKFLLSKHSFNQIKVSRYSLKEGVLFG